MAQETRAHLLISGRVQGVFFRRFAQQKAKELGIAGWARNLIDGGVEIMAEGEKENIERFIDWCKSGPPLAKVKDIKVSYEKYVGEWKDFELREFGF